MEDMEHAFRGGAMLVIGGGHGPPKSFKKIFRVGKIIYLNNFSKNWPPHEKLFGPPICPHLVFLPNLLFIF